MVTPAHLLTHHPHILTIALVLSPHHLAISLSLGPHHLGPILKFGGAQLAVVRNMTIVLTSQTYSSRHSIARI
jgi:hypothetical protein